MAALAITSFAGFARLTIAACRLGAGPADPDDRLAALAAGARSLDAAFATPGLAARAAGIGRAAEDLALHFTHPGRARDDAVALFWQVAPVALADPAALAGDDPAAIVERMVAAIRASALGRDFRQSVLAEPLFRLVAQDALAVILA